MPWIPANSKPEYPAHYVPPSAFVYVDAIALGYTVELLKEKRRDISIAIDYIAQAKKLCGQEHGKDLKQWQRGLALQQKSCNAAIAITEAPNYRKDVEVSEEMAPWVDYYLSIE